MQRPSPQDILLRTLRRATEERDSIRQEPLTRPVQNTAERPTFFNRVLTTFFVGNEEQMFLGLQIDRAVFHAALNCVNSVPLRRRGRPGFVDSHRDKLLFLMVFLSTG